MKTAQIQELPHFHETACESIFFVLPEQVFLVNPYCDSARLSQRYHPIARYGYPPPPQKGYLSGTCATSPQHTDPHGFLVWFSLKGTKTMWISVLWAGLQGRHVDHPCGGRQISPWPARKVTECCSCIPFLSKIIVLAQFKFCKNSKTISLQSKFLHLFSCKQGKTSGSNTTKKMFLWNLFCNMTKSITKISVPRNCFVIILARMVECQISPWV